MGDIAFNLDDYPNDPLERFPFIEGYAHVGKWDRAYELTEQSLSVSPTMAPLLCKLWQKINTDIEDSNEKGRC
jgi:hypothetical protein